MGMNTTVLIMNDFISRICDEIRNNPKELADTLQQMISTGQTGEVTQGFKIIECHHADNKVLIEMGYNDGKRLENYIYGPIGKKVDV